MEVDLEYNVECKHDYLKILEGKRIFLHCQNTEFFSKLRNHES